MSRLNSHNVARARLALLAGLILGVWPVAAPLAAAQTDQATTGWVCGIVTDESRAFLAGAHLTLTPKETPQAEPVAQATADERGTFCVQGLPPGFYILQPAKEHWPTQPTRTVEVRAGLVNKLTPIEMEREPGEPRVSYEESFEGMSVTEARAVLERLLEKGDVSSIQEAARRFLPKREIRIDINRMVFRLEVKPLLEEMLRQIDRGLPPIKTARYVFLVGELADPRTRTPVVRELLRRLNDARPLPPEMSVGFGDGEKAFVSDVAMRSLVRLTEGDDFKWHYGKSPLQNRSAISKARLWWSRELDRQSENKR